MTTAWLTLATAVYAASTSSSCTTHLQSHCCFTLVHHPLLPDNFAGVFIPLHLLWARYSGAKTQLAGFVTSIVVMFVLLFLTPGETEGGLVGVWGSAPGGPNDKAPGVGVLWRGLYRWAHRGLWGSGMLRGL